MLGEAQALGPPSMSDGKHPYGGAVSVLALPVRVWSEENVDVAAVEAHDQGEISEAFRVLAELESTASQIVHEFLSWARVIRGQTWLTRTAQYERAISSALIDDATGRRVPIGLASPIEIILPGRENILTVNDFNQMTGRVQRRETPELADELLAEAGSLVITDHWREAVIAAAVAAEVKVKATLMAGVANESRLLLDLMLESPRDFSQAALALFDKVAAVALGRSLRKDDKALFKRVDELYQLRNAVAHRGRVPTSEESVEAVATARDVFRWLDPLVPKSLPAEPTRIRLPN